VQQIARFSAAQGGRSSQLCVGDPAPLPPTLPRNQSLRVTLPDGTTQTRFSRSETNPILLDRTEQAGFYEAAAGNEREDFAVNPDPSESNLLPLDPAALDKLTAHTLLVGPEALSQWLSKSQGLVPVWPLLLILALLVFAAEGMLSNHMARRRSQGDEQQILTGRLNRRRMGVPFYGPREGTP